MQKRQKPRLTKSQRRFLVRVLEYPQIHGRPYRPRGRFTLLTAKRLIGRRVLRKDGDCYVALYDPRGGTWL